MQGLVHMWILFLKIESIMQYMFYRLPESKYNILHFYACILPSTYIPLFSLKDKFIPDGMVKVEPFLNDKIMHI